MKFVYRTSKNQTRYLNQIKVKKEKFLQKGDAVLYITGYNHNTRFVNFRLLLGKGLTSSHIIFECLTTENVPK